MERVILFGALSFAALVAAGAIFGVGFPSFGAGMEAMRPVAAGKLASQTYPTKKIDIEHAAVRVVITPEDRQDVAIEIDNPGQLPMPEIKLGADGLMIDGHLRGRTSCQNDGGAVVKGYGAFSPEALPQIIIRTPKTVDMDFDAAGSASIGAADAASVSMAGCGMVKLADVAGALELKMAGATNAEAAGAERLDFKAAGANRATFGIVRNGAEIDLAGSSDADLAQLDGALDLHSAGAGTLTIGKGALSTLAINNAGAGTFNLGAGSVQTLTVKDAGAGTVKVSAPVKTLNADLMGAGSVLIEDTVGDINAKIAGAGDIKVKAMTGALSKKMLGAGSVTVGK